MKFTKKGEQSRQVLLDVAIEIFAQKGLSGASVDEIVKASGINPRMIYHYFGSKAHLYQAAFEAEYSKLEALEIKSFDPNDPIKKVIADMVYTYFFFLHNNPNFVRLLSFENLNQGKNLDKMQIRLSKNTLLKLLIKALKAGQKNGTVRRDVDATLLLANLIGSCTIYFSNRFTLSRGLQIDLNSPRVLARAQKAIATMVLSGIET